jgi:hypothetical protein
MSVQQPEKNEPEDRDDADEGEATAGEEAAAEARETAARTEEDGKEPPKAPPSPRSRREGPSWLPLAIAVAAPVLFFFVLPPLTRSGLWDPHELNVADLARRIAINLHGAADLALDGADNSLPHLNDLGRPQLPFTSIALGFKTFGLHEWAGRAPLALWGVLGVIVTFGWVSRLIDRRAAVFSAIALTTMPLYFVQSRTMLGDVVTMSAFSMAFGGLAVAAFSRKDDGTGDESGRIAWLVIGVAGLFAGWFCRGGLVSVGAPLLSIGAAYFVVRANDRRGGDLFGWIVGGASLVAGLYVSYTALVALQNDKGPDLNPWIGAMLKPPAKYPTYDMMLGHVAEALVPWSAFAPFAFGRLFMPPIGRPEDAARARESHTRLALVVAAGVAFAAHGWMASKTDLVAFSAPAVIAAVCGIALRDYERGAHPSVAVGVGTGVLLGCFHHELHNLPEKAFNAFAVISGTFPESFKAHALLIWTIVLIGMAGLTFLVFVERDSKREPFDPSSYLRVLLALRDAWDGMLALAYFALVAGASLAGLAVWMGTRYHAKWLPSLSSQTREYVLNGWWATAFVPLVIIFGIYFWCDVFLWAFHRGRPTDPLGKSATRGFEPFEDLAGRLKESNVWGNTSALIRGRLDVSPDKLEDGIGPVCAFILAPLMYLQVPAIVFVVLWAKVGMKWPVAAALAVPSGVGLFLILGLVADRLRGSRGAFLALCGLIVGAILCLSYYPALANQLSPKEVFESYQKLRTGGEPIALYGVGGRTAAYYAGGQPMILKDANAAYEWLMAGEPAQRRFLAVRADELSRLNKTYRERTGTGQNLPVLDDRSSQILLVASSLRGDEKNKSPLDKIVLTTMPKPQKKLDANMEDKLLVIGFDITDPSGKLVDFVSPGKKYHQKTYFKVLAPVGTDWDMFIHIDGFHRRHNGDHKVTNGKYPMSLWLPGDIVVDDHEFQLEPNFSPGPYSNYFGLYLGESRLKVKSGPTDGENRVNGGILKVQ